jgi:hypothetical protein
MYKARTPRAAVRSTVLQQSESSSRELGTDESPVSHRVSVNDTVRCRDEAWPLCINCPSAILFRFHKGPP